MYTSLQNLLQMFRLRPFYINYMLNFSDDKPFSGKIYKEKPAYPD